jgi:hypothetical protein
MFVTFQLYKNNLKITKGSSETVNLKDWQYHSQKKKEKCTINYLQNITLHYYLALHSFGFEHTWWWLFQKSVVGTKIYIYVIANSQLWPQLKCVLICNTLGWIIISLAHREDISFRSDISFWFRAKHSLLLLLNAACLVKKKIPIV